MKPLVGFCLEGCALVGGKGDSGEMSQIFRQGKQEGESTALKQEGVVFYQAQPGFVQKGCQCVKITFCMPARRFGNREKSEFSVETA